MNHPTAGDYGDLIANLAENKTLRPGWYPLAPFGEDDSVGFHAGAYQHSATGYVVIAFEGPSSATLIRAYVGWGLWGGASRIDKMLSEGVVPEPYERKVRSFVDSLKDRVGWERLSSRSGAIFMAGNSLGGYAAQIAASHFTRQGMRCGGASFGGPGIPNFLPQNPGDFQSYVTYGDPVANAASDTGIDWSQAATVWPGAAKFGAHYGEVVMIGDRGDHERLKSAIKTTTSTQVRYPLNLTIGQLYAAKWQQLMRLHHYSHYLTLLPKSIPPGLSSDACPVGGYPVGADQRAD